MLELLPQNIHDPLDCFAFWYKMTFLSESLVTQSTQRWNINDLISFLLYQVSQLFKDQSIGEGVDIVLVGLILLETDEVGHHSLGLKEL